MPSALLLLLLLLGKPDEQRGLISLQGKIFGSDLLDLRAIYHLTELPCVLQPPT